MAILYKLIKPLPTESFYSTSEDPGDSLADFNGQYRLDKAKKEALVSELQKITHNYHTGISFIVWDCSGVELRLSDIKRLTDNRFVFEEYFEADTENYPGYHAGIDYSI